MSNEVNSLSIIENTDMTTFKQSMLKIGQFQKLVRENLQDGKDYGTIPGTSKPTLYKPGAEKILMLMGLQSTYEILDSTRDFKEGFFQYQVRCTLKKNEMIITQGLGACNSKEKKYERQSGFNIDNTILKMAKKRSQVDASLTVASLSEIFTQDLEDTGIDIEESKQTKQSNTDFATMPQINLIKKKIMGSHLLKKGELKKINDYLEGGMTKTKASEIISWWLGDNKKNIESERAKREAKEKQTKSTKADRIKQALDIIGGKVDEVKDADTFVAPDEEITDEEFEAIENTVNEEENIPGNSYNNPIPRGKIKDTD